MLMVMVAALLGMNTVLALGLVFVWRSQQRLKAEAVTLKDNLHQARARVDALTEQVRQQAQQPSPAAQEPQPSPVVAQQDIKSRLESAQSQPKQMPDRYKAAVNMAGSGMGSEQIADMLGLSAHETEQLAALAEISQPVAETEGAKRMGR